MKFGLIIQGPLLSIGRGVSSYKKKAETNENEIISHQCDETIISNIENYGNLFEKIIISTSLGTTLFENIAKIKSLIVLANTIIKVHNLDCAIEIETSFEVSMPAISDHSRPMTPLSCRQQCWNP